MGGLLRNKFKKSKILPAYRGYKFQEDKLFIERFKHTPYRLYFTTYPAKHGGSIFRDVDRIKLVEHTLKQAFSLEDLVESEFLVQHYCCHQKSSLTELHGSWANFGLLCSRNPMKADVQGITNYVGEKAGFEVSFLQYLTFLMCPLALLAPFSQHVVPPKFAPRTVLGLVLAVWAALFQEGWKRTEHYWCVVWGMESFSEREHVRPQFKGEWEESHVDGHRPMKVYPANLLMLRRLTGLVVSMIFNSLVLCSCAGVFYLKANLVEQGRQSEASYLMFGLAILVQVYNFLWGIIAFSITNFENYETDKEYREAIVIRLFLFRFINSFTSLFYIAFFKHYREGCEPYASCQDELADSLRILYGTDIVMSLIDAVRPYLQYRALTMYEDYRMLKEKKDKEQYQAMAPLTPQRSYLELQRNMPAYTLDYDVADKVSQFIGLGFVLFFGLMASETLLMFFFGNLIRLRAWGWKLLFGMQRVFPQSADGLGIWNTIIYAMSAIAVYSNIAQIILINAQGPVDDDIFLSLKRLVATEAEGVSRENDWKTMMVTFFVVERGIFIVRWFIDVAIPDQGEEAVIAQKRRDVMTDNF